MIYEGNSSREAAGMFQERTIKHNMIEPRYYQSKNLSSYDLVTLKRVSSAHREAKWGLGATRVQGLVIN